jgi:hypothetical protein
MEIPVKYPSLYLIMLLKFHITRVVARQICWCASCWIENAKPFALLWSLDPSYKLKKPNALKIWPIYLVLTSIVIFMLELMQFPSNEKILQKISISYTPWFMNSKFRLLETSCHIRPRRQSRMPLHTTFYN